MVHRNIINKMYKSSWTQPACMLIKMMWIQHLLLVYGEYMHMRIMCVRLRDWH